EYKSARDKLKGTFGINLTYKRLTVNVDMRYAFGGYKFNEDLFNRVENVTSGKALYKNQDKRAFTDRWKEPGDIAKYKNIRVDVNNASNLTTRFIQKNNYIESTNITATWRFSDYKWVQEIGLQGLDLSLSSNNLVRLSTIKRSRGTQYPFQRTCTLKLSCAF
ncbi:SusC/RagA family TonB-linked outer membrane protein, partial [Alistipes sp. OttesenSCG-928-B03]|nr:SusC/RagA family TonB-linked outer membrane protein [Alistipes sp. OttesenSCG-928-B03]